MSSDANLQKLKERQELYRARQQRFTDEAQALAARSRLISNFRGVAFATLVIASIAVFVQGSFVPAGVVALLAGIAFVALVARHARIIAREEDRQRFATVNRDALWRTVGKWSKISETGQRFASDAHPYASDLDVFGTNSLFQRISVAHTRYGQERLAEYLKTPAPAVLVRQRQEAVKELAEELELRQQLEAHSLAVVEPLSEVEARKQPALKEPPDPEPLLRWAEEKPELSTQRVLRVAGPVLPFFVVGGIVANIRFDWPMLVWLVPLAMNLVLLMRARGVAERVFNAVSATEGAFLRYGAMLELIEKAKVEAPMLKQIQERLLSGSQRPSSGMQEFRRKVGWFDLRHNGLVHPFAALFLLWDINCVLALERWQQRSGAAARGWFEALGEFEALSSLAGLVHDEPGSSFPDVVEQGACFEAQELGHVLIMPERRVCNDVALSRAGTALLVTGSNMSGKSTFLRAMGLALVMAFSGAPVIARSLRVSPFSVRTSIRVSDSLGSGVSHFYAELGKLKAVVEGTRQGLPVFFLLDEILHGTNSRERQIGARWVLAELLKRDAVGVVTTHDMGLCQLSDDLMQLVEQVHFRESVENDKMSFDYKLRPGPVTAGNALRLMRLLGLNVPLDEEPA